MTNWQRRAYKLKIHLLKNLIRMLAFLWRLLLFRTTFIAITGSVGKTTAKECLAAILSSRYPTAYTFANQNGDWGVPRCILRVRPWHRYAVIEVATGGPGQIRRSVRLVRPHIALILSVRLVHLQGFSSLESIAKEKASLLSGLRPGGLAVMNGDDPQVAAMSIPAGIRTLWFGSSPTFEYSVSNVSSRWPERLTFQFTWDGQSYPVRTRLVGTHWTPSVAGAIAAALACGWDPNMAAVAVEKTEPTQGRLRPMTLPGGAIILRDDYGAQLPTLEPALKVLREAEVRRRILVTSDISATSRGHRRRLRFLGREAARSVDSAVFIDSRGEDACKAAIQEGLATENVHHFVDLRKGAEFLRRELQTGDLVLLKGRNSHHLARVYFAQLGSIECWKTDCRLRVLCDLCPRLRPGLEYVSAPHSEGVRSGNEVRSA